MPESLLVFLVAIAGGVVPLVVHWTDRRLHGALALSTGIFLGAVFLHLLPSLDSLELDGELVWICVLVGVLGVYLIESLVLRTHEGDDVHRHRAVGYAALLALSVHALTEGLGWAVASGTPEISGPLLTAIISHKAFESFSLASVFRLAEMPRRRIVAFVLMFSVVTPLGMLVGASVAEQVGAPVLDVLTALAAGTFLFVCLSELLPEVFHHREDILVKILVLGAGIGLMAAFHGPHG